MRRRLTAALATVAIAASALTACSGAQDPAGSAAGSAGALTVTDVTGRNVNLDKTPERILLAEGRALFATSILNKDNPLDNVVAIGEDLHSAAPSFEEKLLQAKPELAKMPTVGSMTKGDVSVENLVSFQPDIIVMTLDHKKAAEESGMLTKMDQAGLKYVFTDFRDAPLDNTPKSMTLLGKLFGKEDKAKEYVDFYEKKVNDITSRARDIKHKPTTLYWRAGGMTDCCATNNNSNLADLINAAGGDNIGDHLLATPKGDITAEKVVESKPEHIIITGGAWAKDPKTPEFLPHVEMGYTAERSMTDTTLAGLKKTPGFNVLEAPRNGNFHALYHQFYDSPFNVFALEQFAQWLHPEEFKDLDPQGDFEKFHAQWLPISYSGTFFHSLQPER